MRKPNSLQDANFCSRLFWWLNPLFKIGYKQKLEEDDMYSLLPEDASQHVGEELQEWAQAAGRRGERVLGSGSEESWERCRGAIFNESNHKVLLEILCSLGNFYISWGRHQSNSAHILQEND